MHLHCADRSDYDKVPGEHTAYTFQITLTVLWCHTPIGLHSPSASGTSQNSPGFTFSHATTQTQIPAPAQTSTLNIQPPLLSPQNKHCNILLTRKLLLQLGSYKCAARLCLTMTFGHDSVLSVLISQLPTGSVRNRRSVTAAVSALQCITVSSSLLLSKPYIQEPSTFFSSTIYPQL